MERVQLVAAKEIVQIITVFGFQTVVLIDTAVQRHTGSCVARRIPSSDGVLVTSGCARRLHVSAVHPACRN